MAKSDVIWRHHTFNNNKHLKFGLRSLDVIENATTEYMADAISYYWISGLVICSNVHEICKKASFPYSFELKHSRSIFGRRKLEFLGYLVKITRLYSHSFQCRQTDRKPIAIGIALHC